MCRVLSHILYSNAKCHVRSLRYYTLNMYFKFNTIRVRVCTLAETNVRINKMVKLLTRRFDLKYCVRLIFLAMILSA